MQPWQFRVCAECTGSQKSRKFNIIFLKRANAIKTHIKNPTGSSNRNPIFVEKQENTKEQWMTFRWAGDEHIVRRKHGLSALRVGGGVGGGGGGSYNPTVGGTETAKVLAPTNGRKTATVEFREIGVRVESRRVRVMGFGGEQRWNRCAGTTVNRHFWFVEWGTQEANTRMNERIRSG